MSLRARAEAMAREAAPLPRLFGAQAVRIAALLRIAPQLALRLSLAPTRDVHAVAAFLEAQAAAGMPLEAMAAAIGSSDPRALLDRALPGRDARLFRALDRAILPAWSVEEIAALDEVIRSDIADTLGTAGGITRTNLAAARLLLSSHPVLRRTRAHITDAWTRQRLTAVLVWLQGQGTLRSLGATPEGAGAKAVARRLRDDLAAMQGAPCAFTVPDGWDHLRTPGALWSAGMAFRNCLAPGAWGGAAHVLGLLGGTDVYLLSADKRRLAHLRRLGGKVWSLVAVLGASNRPAADDDRRALVGALKRDGLVILDVELDAALDTMLAPLRDNSIEAAEDPTDDGGAQEVLAANIGA